MVAAARRRHGIILVAVSAVLWSTAGLFVRMAALDTWTMVAWRSAFAGITIGIVAMIPRRKRPLSLPRLGVPDLVTIALAVVSSISYILALRLTTVANTMTVFATLPFIATAAAYLLLGERVTARFVVAGLVALVGIAVMAGAVASARDLLGVLVAFLMTCGYALQLVHARRHPALDTTVLVALAAAVCVPIAAPLMSFEMPAPLQLLACALYGMLTTGFAYVLALEGGRLIPSAEAGLVSLIEVVLGPVWVWVFFAERPTPVAFISGSIVLAAVVWYLVTSRGSDGGEAGAAALVSAKS